MFIQASKYGYNRHGEQFCHGYFLILMARENGDRKDVRGLIRFVRMGQLGHFMMARLTVKKHKLSLSGSYGADGLIMTVPDEVFELGLPLPTELYEAWAKGDGWNSAGSEAPLMTKWAKENFKRLRNK